MEKLHIVSLSGGLGSFIELKLTIDEFGEKNTTALFADVRMEDPDLYRFLHETLNHFRCSYTIISEGRNPWELFTDIKFLGDTKADPCSQILKRNLIKQHILKNYDRDTIIVHLGIDYTEKHRLESAIARTSEFTYTSLQVERKMMLTPDEKIKFSENLGIKPPILYSMGFSHNNCGGFCIKAGLGQFKTLYEKLPDRYEWHVQKEKELRKAAPTARPFLRKMIKGKTKYLWLEEYREILRSNNISKEEELDIGGCACGF